MKKTLLSAGLIVALLATVFMAACSDDETPTNQIAIGSKKIKLTGTGYVISEQSEGQDGNYYVHTILMPSSGLTVDENGYLDGRGHLTVAALRSKTATLAVGTYKLGLSTSLPDVEEFVVLPNLDAEEGPEELYFGWAGNIIVSKSGSKYVIKIDLHVYSHSTEFSEEFGDDDIEGNFKGEITVIEEDIIARKDKAFDLSRFKHIKR